MGLITGAAPAPAEGVVEGPVKASLLFPKSEKGPPETQVALRVSDKGLCKNYFM
jgi:hypothetical protein